MRTSYSYLGDTLTQVNIDAPTGSTSLHFTYDEIGPMSVTYNGAEYFYLKNAQGDVTGLVNSSTAAVYSTNRLPLHPGFLCISEKCGCPLDGNEKKAYNQCIS